MESKYFEPFWSFSYDRMNEVICSYADNVNEQSLENLSIHDHFHSLKDAFQLDSIVYLSEASRIVYFFTTAASITQEDIFYQFFKSTHPELSTHQLEALEGQSLIYQGEEALDFMLKLLFHPGHSKYMPRVIEQARTTASNQNLMTPLMDFTLTTFSEKITEVDEGMPFDPLQRAVAVKEAILKYQKREALLNALEAVSGELDMYKERAVKEIFKKDLANLDAESQQVIVELLAYLTDKSGPISSEIAKKL
ncbi:MAG: hypothetical protein AAF598_13850 [Bacteroidota bacterium]